MKKQPKQSTTKREKRPQVFLSGPGKTFMAAFLIAVSAFFLHALFLKSNIDRDWPYSIFYFGDAHHYHRYAVALIRGEPYDEGLPYHPPMFAWILSFLYRWMGIPQASGFPYKLWMAGCNAATTGLMWLWLRNRIGTLWASIAAVFLMLHFGWMLFSATFNNEALYSLCLTATVALVSIKGSNLSWGMAVLLGAIMGIGTLTRAENIGLWPFLILYLWLIRDHRAPDLRRHISRWGLAVFLSVCCVLPWTVRNAIAIDQFNKQTPELEPLSRVALVTSYGPLNFVLANHEEADGGFRPDLIVRIGSGGMIDLRNSSHRHWFIHGYSEGLKWIREHPADFGRLVLHKLDRWLDGLALGFGVSNWPGGLSGSRPPVDVFVPWKKHVKWPMTVLLVTGMILSFRTKWLPLSICSLIVLHRLFITVSFFGYARGMILLLPLILPLLLLPLIALSERIPLVRRSAIVFAVVALIGFTTHALGIASREPRNYIASGSIDPRTGRIIQDDWVDLHLKK